MTKTDFFNAALLKIGSQIQLVGEGEKTTEEDVCNACYEQALKEVYVIYPWRCCRRYAALSQLEKCEHIKFRYAYQLPLDFLVLADIYPERELYEIAGRKLYTNTPEVKIGYTANIENLGELTPQVYELAVCKLAMKILPSLAKGSYSIKDGFLQEFWNIQYIQAKNVEIRENAVRPPAQWWIEEQ